MPSCEKLSEPLVSDHPLFNPGESGPATSASGEGEAAVAGAMAATAGMTSDANPPSAPSGSRVICVGCFAFRSHTKTRQRAGTVGAAGVPASPAFPPLRWGGGARFGGGTWLSHRNGVLVLTAEAPGSAMKYVTFELGEVDAWRLAAPDKRGNVVVEVFVGSVMATLTLDLSKVHTKRTLKVIQVTRT